ncbi:MAG: hypothetical protein K6B40_00835 [Firmicutes bacterium]|nr:hypothetical protein [Bacillota bacterium]
MDENSSKKYYRQLKEGLTDRDFLKRTGLSRKAMLAAFAQADLKKIAGDIQAAVAASRPANAAFHIPLTAAEQTPVDVRALTRAALPLLEALQRAGDIPDRPAEGDWLRYAYETMLARMFPAAEAPVCPEKERPGVLIFLELLHIILQQERSEREMIPTFDLDLLTEEEAAACVSGREYIRLLRCSRAYYFHELHVIASQITSFNILSHVAGVHFVAMHMARQLQQRQVPVDLAMVSAAAATHDIGKFGCRGDEVRRLPHLHYYYTDAFLRRVDLPGVAHIASNHSTWDLELENLSCENLLLIYADFRVKSGRNGDGQEVARFYTMEESFDVILNKLENVDDAKRSRYQRVYEKLYDFEQYMISIGVSPDLQRVGDQPRCWADAALLDAVAAKERLKYLAIEHNIYVMNRFGSESDFGDLLEEAKSGKNWQNIHAYLNTLEEYFTYMTLVQKQMTIGFLRELLILRGGNIRRQAAGLIGRIIASYDQRYRKELPAGIRIPKERVDSGKLWEEHLRVVIEPDLKRTERQQRWIGYSLKVTMAALLSHSDESNRRQYLQQFFGKLKEKGHTNMALFILADTVLEIRMEYLQASQTGDILRFCREAMQQEDLEIRIAVLRILHRLAAEGSREQLTEAHCRQIEALLEVPVAGDETVSVAYLKYRARQSLQQKGRLTEMAFEHPRALDFSDSDIFRDNLKVYTPWVIKAVNIEVMLDGLQHGGRDQVFYIATHLSNLLKVSERVTVRHKAGRGLLQIVDLMTREQRNEIVIELTKGLEIGEYQFSKYIPEYLGVLIMHLHPEELSEILHELKHLLQSKNDKVASLTLDTLAVMLQNYEEYRRRFPEAEDIYLRRREKIIGMLLSGMANYHAAVSQEGFFALGKMVFGSPHISMEAKAEIFQVLHKKMLTLIEDRKGDFLQFFNNAASLNHVYRFISDYQFFRGDLPLREMKKAAFFPGTFDPFSTGHKGIVTTVRNMGYEVYLALDEFSWSKNTQARLYRKRIMSMSCADEPGVYIFPDDQPINIAAPEDVVKLRRLLAGKELYIVVGSDVIAGASSYRKEPEADSIHSLNHIIFRRETVQQEDAEDAYRDGLSKITGKVVELTLPVHLEDISSTKIRDNIDNNRDVASLIDPVVQNYIYDNALYMRQPMYKFILSAKNLNFQTLREDGVLREVRITDSSKGDALIARAQVYPVESVHLFEEFGDVGLAAYVRQAAAGRSLIIHRLEADPAAVEVDPYQLILTEVLCEALKDDYAYAIYHGQEAAAAERRILAVLQRQGFREIVIDGKGTGCYGVDMRNPVTVIHNMSTILKSPFNKNPKVEKALQKAQIRLEDSLTRLFPDTLILSFDSTIMHHKLIRKITEANGVPAEEQKKRRLGPYMCVPFGKILNGMAVPNTVTKTLHLEKSYAPDLSTFRIREYPNYASIEDQVRTIRSFRRPVILVDDILHKGYRICRLDPLLNENQVDVEKLLVGILSGNGRDLMKQQERAVDCIYFVPNLKVWFVESTMYPFIGGDGVERHTGTIDDDLTSINMIMPYMAPSFIVDCCEKEAFYDFSMVCLENARDILKVLEEEYQRIFQKKLTLQRLSEAIHRPKLTDMGQCLDFDRAIAASAYIEDDMERLQRMRKLL